MKCVICKKTVPKRGKLRAHPDRMAVDEMTAMLTQGWWINPLSGRIKRTLEWWTAGVTTGRTSSSAPNMVNMPRADQKMLLFHQRYRMSGRELMESLQLKALSEGFATVYSPGISEPSASSSTPPPAAGSTSSPSED